MFITVSSVYEERVETRTHSNSPHLYRGLPVCQCEAIEMENTQSLSSCCVTEYPLVVLPDSEKDI